MEVQWQGRVWVPALGLKGVLLVKFKVHAQIPKAVGVVNQDGDELAELNVSPGTEIMRRPLTRIQVPWPSCEWDTARGSCLVRAIWISLY